ncbi:uncharacterized protein V1513DRAFT_378381 [Lipomyces chichibuensis]|uniref:uncharacterized protein n=1 Tax=Lipomyces chichibuensis TaxID=1546026 RepID=UPI00334428D0
MLLSRAIHHTVTACYSVLDNEDRQIDIPKGPAFALVSTFILCLIAVALVQYVGNVILTLAAVEDPYEGYSPLSNESSQHLMLDNDDDEGEAPREAINSGKDRFVTSSIRRTVAYLRNEAGPWSPFRGMSAYIVMQIISSLYTIFVVSLWRSIFQPFLYLILFLCLAPLSLVLTHIIITVPTQRTWFRRLRSTPFRLSKLTLPVVGAEYIVRQVTYIFPNLLMFGVALPYMARTGWTNFVFGTVVFVIGIALFLLLFVFLSLPVTVVRIRVQAALLPQGEEPIIPFDSKAFGTVTTMRDAMYSLVNTLKTFSLSDRMRLFKLIVKFYVIALTMTAVFMFLFTVELLWMVKESPDIGQYLKDTFSNGQ